MKNKKTINYVPDLSQVIKKGLCIGCGACELTYSGVSLTFNNQKMMYEPSNPGDQNAALVCPSVSVDYQDLVHKRFPNEIPNPFGAIRKILLAQNTDETLNRAASSGGVIKAVLIELLSSNEVDGVISLDHREGINFEPILIKNIEYIKQLPGSIYHNVNFSKAIHLLKNNQGKFAVVGIPCQLEGLLKYIYSFDAELINKLHILVGLICGWTYSHHSLQAICQFKNIHFRDIQNISYRGGNAVGQMQIRTCDGLVSINRKQDWDYIVAFDHSFNINRCFLCVNHTNIMADLVIGDAWLKRTSKSRTGVSLVICRNEISTKIMDRLVNSRRIRIAPASTDDIIESQGEDLVFGVSAKSYARFFNENKWFHPSFLNDNNGIKEKPFLEMKKFYQELLIKKACQERNEYSKLWWRKIIFDLFVYGKKYLLKTLQKHNKTNQDQNSKFEINDFL